MKINELLSLKNKYSLVTGGAGHLGQVIVKTLVDLGAHVTSADLVTLPDLEQEKYLKVDLMNEIEVRNLPIQACSPDGCLDILINCAAFVGTSRLKGWAVPFEQQSSDTWRKAFEVNLNSVFNLTQAAVPFLKKSSVASVINIASIYGICGPDMSLYEGTNMGNPSAYATSKAGLIQFTRWCSTTLAPIRFNCITPGGIFRQQPDFFVKKYCAKVPLNRMATEDDFSGAIAYLASNMSNYVTGHNLVVDGGFSVW